MTSVAIACQRVAECMEAYLDGKLDKLQRAEVETHLSLCPSCEQSVQCSRAVYGLLEYVQIENVEDHEPEESVFEKVRGVLGAAPWWAVSVALHALVLTLAGLLSMNIKMPSSDDSIIVVTELQARVQQAEVKKEQEQREQVLSGEKDVPPTELNNKEQSNILVPPDILQRAELGDHFETINPDRPDTSSAFGTEDSQMFHSVSGDADAAGGGGEGGAALEGLIGIGGPAGKGTGGGFGGGDGTGTGLGKGAGHGSFGSRNGGGRKLMVKRHGGSKETEGAVDMALRWLAYHQEPDGRWDSQKHGANRFKETTDTSVTGLAVLAFLGAGHTEKVGQYKDNVKRAIQWLISQQQPNGSIQSPGDWGHGYTFAIATLALSEAAGMANVKETREAAQKAVNYCVDIHQIGEGSDKFGWDYGPKGKGDMSVSGWFIMALKSAKVSGLKVDHMAFQGAINFLDAFQFVAEADKTYGTAWGYIYRLEHRDTGIRTSAIGCLCRQFLGWKKEEMQPSVEHFVRVGGYPGEKPGVDIYYWYYGALCTFQQGGEVWKHWNEGMKKTLPPLQRKDGDEAGSWDPAGFVSDGWGRVGQTALSALCLEVYYRYLQLTPDK